MSLTAELTSRGAGFCFGFLLFAITSLSVMRTVVTPRNLSNAITDAVIGTVVGTSRLFARLGRTYRRRDGALAWAGPSIILALLLTWLFSFIIAYGLMIYGLSGESLGAAVRESGSSLLTLGFFTAKGNDATFLDFAAAATGPVVIALMIGYLPNVYQTYLDREVNVTLIAGSAGEPNWGPELISRVCLAKSIDNLPAHLGEWATWSAKLRMTHITYPMLIYVRSIRGTNHFLVSLNAVLDASALILALNTTLPRTPIYTTLLHGAESVQALYVNFAVRRPKSSYLPIFGRLYRNRLNSKIKEPKRLVLPSRDAQVYAVQSAASQDAFNALIATGFLGKIESEKMVTTLAREEFDYAVDILRRSGFPINVDVDSAWEMFKNTRATYEYPMYALLRRLDATPAPWTGPRNIATPTMWPTLAIDLYERDQLANAKSPDVSSAPPAPDAAGR